jgi:hypothetical protein
MNSLRKLIREVIENNLNTGHNITDIVKQTAKDFMEKDSCSLEQINQGSCGYFASAVIERMGGTTDNLYLMDTYMFYTRDEEKEGPPDEPYIEIKSGGYWFKDMLDKYGPIPKDVDFSDFVADGHEWVYYNGKHYDAEAPGGVKTMWDLPFFKRELMSWRSKH